jgi:aminomuconate-semialdehyde/2-hydroxymuconate-6-semialdehyde dehydrogenase
LGDIIKAAGVPDGVFNLVHGYGHEVGQAIIEHPKIAGISFTGGTATGQKVAATAAPMFKKLSLELGGKNPTIVFADCDLEKTVAGACRSAFTNSGQVCLAGSRVFVERSIYKEFLEKFVEKAKSMVVGDPNDQTTQLGPVSSYQHLEKIRWYLTKAEEEGGRIMCGGKETPPLPSGFENGFFISPTVIDGLSPESTPSKDEIFGPVCTVHPFDSEDDLVEAANNVRYGLAGSIWTSDLSRAHRLASRIEVGILWINCWLLRDLRTPFGGVKDSGIGREGGKHSLEFYSEYRNVCIKYDA